MIFMIVGSCSGEAGLVKVGCRSGSGATGRSGVVGAVKDSYDCQEWLGDIKLGSIFYPSEWSGIHHNTVY